MVDFKITYTAGYFGIDDTGSLKICLRFATDMGRPQFADPAKPNYVSVRATNGAILEYRFDVKGHVRPWDKTIYIKIIKGFLRKGDQLIAHFGDPAGGCPGMRMQTFCENPFQLKVFVDPLATCQYAEVPNPPTMKIVPGEVACWKAQLPTLRRVGEHFSLLLKAEDAWGNPTDRVDHRFALIPSLTVDNLPDEVTLRPETGGVRWFHDLRVSEEGELTINVIDRERSPTATSNTLRVAGGSPFLHYWGELHGQSGETIGTNSAREYFEFARDKAGVDVVVHQGNDFQITSSFWDELQKLTREFHSDRRLVTFPGYEWSGNTGLGGDRNVLFRDEGEAIRRSSHACLGDLSDLGTDCNTVEELFEALPQGRAIVFAHVGGRYADVDRHDARVQSAVEVHSAWGTFEWILEDALRQGHRVGVICNSDDHKGRPGASYPGASLFGSYGGLTCLLANDLTRAGIWEALRRRRHYGTTGARIYLDVRARLNAEAKRFLDNPQVSPPESEATVEALMGDIVQTADRELSLEILAIGTAPIASIELRNGLEVVKTFRPYGDKDLGRRLRVVWSGAEYRGRGRETIWDGSAGLTGNSFEAITAINFHNPEKRLRQTGKTSLEWQSLTTGGTSGFECLLASSHAGMLKIETPLVRCEIPVQDIGIDDLRFEAGGLAREMRICRLPDLNPHRRLKIRRHIALRSKGDNALYVCVTQEDGHQAWSSPIYMIAE